MSMSGNYYNSEMNNYHSYNKNSQNIMNSAIIQGKLFNKYANEYHEIGEHKENFMDNSNSTSGVESVMEAMESIESVQQSNTDLNRTNSITQYEDEMNKLTSEYSTLYNSYSQNETSLSAKENKDIEEELLRKKDRLKLLSENIKNEMTKLLKDNEITIADATSDANTGTGANTGIMEGFEVDNNTAFGKMETTHLSMTSNYYFYLVYFIVAITLLSFIFNIMVNPTADAMNALFVVGGIVLVFLISKMMS
jgi:hypothetical protein